ncbi:hypothetical protein GCM10023080_047470 [Streptomyces pseudoechinosporeus]
MPSGTAGAGPLAAMRQREEEASSAPRSGLWAFGRGAGVLEVLEVSGMDHGYQRPSGVR